MTTIIIEKDLSSEDVNIEASFSNIIKHTLLVIFIFMVSFAIFKFIVWAYKLLKNKFFDNKKNYDNRLILKKYFYQKILNDITMALSLVKKCTSRGGGGPKVSDDIQKIYFYEAYYYFELAMSSIIKANIIEYPCDTRDDYDDLLVEMNPCMIRNTLDLCVNALNNMMNDAIYKEIRENDFIIKVKIELLVKQYNNMHSNVDRQIEIIRNKGLREEGEWEKREREKKEKKKKERYKKKEKRINKEREKKEKKNKKEREKQERKEREKQGQQEENGTENPTGK